CGSHRARPRRRARRRPHGALPGAIREEGRLLRALPRGHATTRLVPHQSGLVSERTTMRLQDRVAIVTGAGGGIGRPIANGLARGGSPVVAADISVATAEQTAREIAAAGGKAIAFGADVADLTAHERLVAVAIEGFGRLDILVNNAG